MVLENKRLKEELEYLKEVLEQTNKDNTDLLNRIDELEDKKHELYLDYMELNNIYDITYNQLKQKNKDYTDLLNRIDELELENQCYINKISNLLNKDKNIKELKNVRSKVIQHVYSLNSVIDQLDYIIEQKILNNSDLDIIDKIIELES